MSEFRGLSCPDARAGLLAPGERKEETREKVRCAEVKGE